MAELCSNADLSGRIKSNVEQCRQTLEKCRPLNPYVGLQVIKTLEDINMPSVRTNSQISKHVKTNQCRDDQASSVDTQLTSIQSQNTAGVEPHEQIYNK